MDPSLPGLIVCGALLLVGWLCGAPVLIALFASLPFGSTAFGTLTSLGGSTPLVYTLMAVLLVAVTASRRRVLHDLAFVFRTQPAAWVVLGLLVYVVLGAQILPRLFAGTTQSFAISRGGILEQPLIPTSGNITQPGYFALGVLTFYCVAILLLRRGALEQLRRGFFVFVTLNLLFGVVDLGGKLAGLGDVLSGIRTASYAFLVEVSASGFWRITGAHPESSAFAIWTLACLGFTLVHWRTTGSHRSLLLAVVAFVLVLLSTSTTAYVGLAVMGLIYGLSAMRGLGSGRVGRRDVLVAAVAPVVVVAALAVHLASEKALDPVVDLIDTMVLNKAQSASGQERAYWNERSLASLSDTYGLGVGLGSSRASSWLIAVVSQLGVPGAMLMGLLVVELLRPPAPVPPTRAGRDMLGFYRGARAAALAFLVGGALSGGAADPGILFFICLAIALASRASVQRPATVPAPVPGGEAIRSAVATGGAR